MLTPRQAVEIATADNENWMMTARGIVDFILSECSLENVGNDEYDNVILQNPAESRRIADELDRQQAAR